MTAVMLLSAGHGTRLGPLTDERPKALVPLGDRPVIAHQIERVRAVLGQVQLVVNAHHLAKQIVVFLKAYDPEIQVLVEADLLGTAGGLRGALKYLGHEPLVVVNSDVISTINYPRLLRKVTEQSLVLCVAPRLPGQGTVGLDDHGRIVRLRNETFGIEVAGGDYLGVAAMGERIAERLPAKGCLVSDFMLPMLRSKLAIQSQLERAAWLDIGNLASYARANFDWLREQSLSAWADPASEISDQVSMNEAIVGCGALVGGQGPLRRVIIWPSAHLDAPLCNSIVMASGLVVPIPEPSTSSQ